MLFICLIIRFCYDNKSKNTYFQRSRPSPIALEPCNGNRGAVLSLIVRLPTGGKPYAPNGCTGMAVASALVTLGIENYCYLISVRKDYKSEYFIGT